MPAVRYLGAAVPRSRESCSTLTSLLLSHWLKFVSGDGSTERQQYVGPQGFVYDEVYS